MADWALEVRTVQGSSISLTVDSDHTIASIKSRLAERNLAPSTEGLSVLFLGHALSDEATLGQAGVTAHDYVVSFWSSGAKKRKKKKAKQQEPDASKHRRLSTHADDNDDLYSGFGRDHGTPTAAEQQLVRADEDPSTRAAVVGGVVGWLSLAVEGLSAKDTLTCAGWLSRAGCDSAASLRSLPKAIILKNTHPSSSVRAKLLAAAGYIEQAAAPSPSTGTTQRLVAAGPEAATAVDGRTEDGSEITDPKVVHAPPPPRPPPPDAIREVQVEVNRGPVMVMWAAAVALKLGHGRDTALSLARAVTNAFSRHKAKHLGIDLRATSQLSPRATASGEPSESVWLMREELPVANTAFGLRARDPASNRIIHPGPVWDHLLRAFGPVLPAVHGAMALLAASLSKETLADGTVPYTLCVQHHCSAPAADDKDYRWYVRVVSCGAVFTVQV